MVYGLDIYEYFPIIGLAIISNIASSYFCLCTFNTHKAPENSG
jgi:hypothetical protein